MDHDDHGIAWSRGRRRWPKARLAPWPRLRGRFLFVRLMGRYLGSYVVGQSLCKGLPLLFARSKPIGSFVHGTHAYPRPRLRRSEWMSLNGPWDFSFDDDERWTWPNQVEWTSTIHVPFAPETR